MQCRGLAVDADVRDVSTGADQAGAQLERLGMPTASIDDVGAEAVGQLLDGRRRVVRDS